MPRGYRCIVIAAVGWLILGTGPQPNKKDQSENKQGQSQPSRSQPLVAAPSPKPVKIVQPEVHAPPCGPNQYQATDDLCAQWKAADAAGGAAFWAMVGTLVAGLGTLGLYWQINLTRKAVRDTGEATNAMREANRIAEDTAKLELRAYVGLKLALIDVPKERPTNAKASHDIELTFTNFGATPASILAINFHLAKGPFDPRDYNISPPEFSDGLFQMPLRILQPGDHFTHRMRIGLSAGELDHINNLKFAIYLSVRLRYVDIYGAAYDDTMGYYCTSRDYRARQFRRKYEAHDAYEAAPADWPNTKS